jgi:hypothetical protein
MFMMSSIAVSKAARMISVARQAAMAGVLRRQAAASRGKD